MGAIALPPKGSVYVDTNILIYTIESHPDYFPLLSPLSPPPPCSTPSACS